MTTVCRLATAAYTRRSMRMGGHRKERSRRMRMEKRRRDATEAMEAGGKLMHTVARQQEEAESVGLAKFLILCVSVLVLS